MISGVSFRLDVFDCGSGDWRVTVLEKLAGVVLGHLLALAAA
jgi:hypothetical protein